MEYSIEVCIKENQTTTDKGRILEDLTRKILKQQQYEVSETIRVTGIEIDAWAKHKITGQKLLLNVKRGIVLCLGKLSLNCLGMSVSEMQVRDG